MSILDKFDSSKEEHVTWLKTLISADTDKKLEILYENPMNQDFSTIEMVHIIFGLCAKYTKSVLLEKDAFIPE